MSSDTQYIHSLFEHAGFPAFPLDSNGFPLPGPVIRYYRERTMHTSSDGQRKHWSQAYLASKLNISELSVRLMETQNKGLEHMERRQAIAEILKIPPALLGLASYNQLEESLKGIGKKSSSDMIDVSLYSEILPLFRSAYEQRELPSTAILSLVERLAREVKSAHGNTKRDLLRIWFEYQILIGRMYYEDIIDTSKAQAHLIKAREIGLYLENVDLQAIARYYTAEMYLEQGKYALAQDELNINRDVLSIPVRGRILTYSALATALRGNENGNISLIDTTNIFRGLDNAEKCISREVSDQNRVGQIKFDQNVYLDHRADTLIAMRKYGKALDVLDDIGLSDSKKRKNEYRNILRAECFAKQSRPDYEQAIFLLENIVNDSKVSNSYYIQYVLKLYNIMQQSTYANEPAMVDLGMALRAMQKRS